MNLSFDPTVPAEVAVVQRMLAALSAPELCTVHGPATVGGMLNDAAKAEFTHRNPKPTSQQCEAMDDTGGIRQSGGPLPYGTVIADPDSVEKTVEYGTYQAGAATYAPSTAAAPLSPSAPEAPQDGAAIDPSVFGQSAAPGPVPPAPTAPAAPTSPAPAAPSPVDKTDPTYRGDDCDSNGLPWDERIHSSSKARVADGSWRQRRNLPDGLREQVEAELRGQSAANSATEPVDTHTTTTIAPPVPPIPSAPPAAPVAPPVPSLPAIPSSTLPAVAPAPAAATASGEPMVEEGDFVALFGKVTKLLAVQGGVFGEGDVHAINERLGLLPAATGMMLLPTRPELVLQYDAAVEGLFA